MKNNYEITLTKGTLTNKELCIMKGVCEGVLNMSLSDSFLDLTMHNENGEYQCQMYVNCFYGPFYASGKSKKFEECLMGCVAELKSNLLNWKKLRFTNKKLIAVPEVFGQMSA